MFDIYLKIWALSQPTLKYDFILIDEAQDQTPVTINVLNNPKEQKKYNTENSQALIGWVWIQLILTGIMALHLFIIMPYLETPQIYIYAIFLMAQVFTYTSILDGSNYALIGEFVKFGLCLGIFFYMDYSWFGLSGIFVIGLIIYLCISLILTYYFLKQNSLNYF